MSKKTKVTASAIPSSTCVINDDIRRDYHVLLAFGDRHAPQNNASLDDIILRIIEVEKPDIIIDGGDMITADCLSHYAKTHDQLIGLQEELVRDHEWRDKILKISPDSRKIVLRDNHFYRRLEDFKRNPMNFFADELEGLDPDYLLKLKEYGWYSETDYTWQERLMFIHGDGHGVSGTSKCPVNKVRQNVRQAMMGIVQFHSHSTGFELVRGAGATHYAIQLGTIMNVDSVDYVKHTEFGNTTNSIGLFYLPKNHIKDKDYFFIPVAFIGNKTILNGRLYVA